MNVGAIDNVDSLYITSIGVHCVKSVETLGCLLLYILIKKATAKNVNAIYNVIPVYVLHQVK